MKLSGLLKKFASDFKTEFHASQALKKAAGSTRIAKNDGFEIARRKPVDLGKQAPASAAADGEFVKGLYRELLNREPDAGGFQSHMNGLQAGMSRESIRQVFLSSPEYREIQTAAANVTQAPAVPTPTAPTANDVGGKMPTTLGPVPLEGYDSNKLNNFSHQTVKYQFGRVATHYGLESVKDKAGAEAVLKKMVPDLEASGLKIFEVKGDSIRVATDLGQEWVDVVRGAGSGNPGWWWGSEGKAIPGTEGQKPPKPPPPGTSAPTSPTGPTAPTGEPGEPLSTVPQRPEYASAPIDRSNQVAAARSAAQWVKDTHPELFGKGDDRQVAFQVMTHVIGAMRAAGFDAHRVVNHPSYPVGQGMRYGSDAVVVGGQIYDLYGSFGEPGKSIVQALDVGPYEAGRLRE